MDSIVTGDTPEAVAYALFLDCLYAAGKASSNKPTNSMSEAEILDLYGRCLAIVRGQRFLPQPGNRTP